MTLAGGRCAQSLADALAVAALDELPADDDSDEPDDPDDDSDDVEEPDEEGVFDERLSVL